MKNKITKQWLVGFTDGDGCFSISVATARGKKYIQPRFYIAQKEVDILEKIQEFLGCGVIYGDEGAWYFRVQDRKDLLEKVIPIFEEYPLMTKKGNEYKKWKKVVETITPYYRKPLPQRIFEEMVKIKETMNRGGAIIYG